VIVSNTNATHNTTAYDSAINFITKEPI